MLKTNVPKLQELDFYTKRRALQIRRKMQTVHGLSIIDMSHHHQVIKDAVEICLCNMNSLKVTCLR